MSTEDVQGKLDKPIARSKAGKIVVADFENNQKQELADFLEQMYADEYEIISCIQVDLVLDDRFATRVIMGDMMMLKD
jgi:hypothetical protein